jgi:hypothetical protein
MKISKQRLNQIIKEELAKVNEDEEFNYWSGPELTPGQQKVSSMIDALIDAVDEMGESSPDMTDSYIALFRALSRAGLNVKAVANMA